jgi:hypothetical protein
MSVHGEHEHEHDARSFGCGPRRETSTSSVESLGRTLRPLPCPLRLCGEFPFGVWMLVDVVSRLKSE